MDSCQGPPPQSVSCLQINFTTCGTRRVTLLMGTSCVRMHNYGRPRWRLSFKPFATTSRPWSTLSAPPAPPAPLAPLARTTKLTNQKLARRRRYCCHQQDLPNGTLRPRSQQSCVYPLPHHSSLNLPTPCPDCTVCDLGLELQDFFTIPLHHSTTPICFNTTCLFLHISSVHVWSFFTV